MTNSKKIEWILRVGIAGEFLGHGLLAIGGKADWLKWIGQMIKVDAATAVTLLTLIGVLDVIVALVVLIKPLRSILRPVLIYATIWGFWTALVRPIVGAGWLDFIERFANWAAPLALFYLVSDDDKK